MPTFREDLHVGHKVPLVETDDIMDGGITTDKLADGAITHDKLAANAVGENNLQDGSVTTDKLADGAVTAEKLAENSVTEDKIANKQVGWQKLDDDLQNIIASREEHGVALSNEFGDSVLIGITQKKLTETIDAIQDKIDSLHPGSYITITASPNLIYKDETSDVDVTVRMTDGAIADKITLFVDDVEEESVENASRLDTTISVIDTTALHAVAERQGLDYDVHSQITGVRPYWVGADAQYTDIIDDAHKQNIKANPNGTYNITVPSNGNYVFFVIPEGMTIHRATMGGFEFPLDALPSIEVESHAYLVYASSNTYDAGSLTIVIS